MKVNLVSSFFFNLATSTDNPAPGKLPVAVASTWTNTEVGLYSRHTINGLAISVSGNCADDLDAIVFDERFSETTGDAYFY